MKAILIGGLLAAGLAVTAGTAGGMHHFAMHAHAGHGGPAERFDGFINQALDDLNATEAQRTRILAVKEKISGPMHRLHGEHAEMHATFLREWKGDKMDTAQLHQLVDAKVEELRGALHGMVDGVNEIHDTLTPDQRRQVVAKVQEMHGHP